MTFKTIQFGGSQSIQTAPNQKPIQIIKARFPQAPPWNTNLVSMPFTAMTPL